MAAKISLNHAGLGEILKSDEVRRMVQDATEKIADHVREQGIEVGAFKGRGQIELPVKAEVTTTDRAHGRVLLAHPAGKAVQAKYGALTKAASAVGLTVQGD